MCWPRAWRPPPLHRIFMARMAVARDGSAPCLAPPAGVRRLPWRSPPESTASQKPAQGNTVQWQGSSCERGNAGVRLLIAVRASAGVQMTEKAS
jgi:hypothetical protein